MRRGAARSQGTTIVSRLGGRLPVSLKGPASFLSRGGSRNTDLSNSPGLQVLNQNSAHQSVSESPIVKLAGSMSGCVMGWNDAELHQPVQ